MNRYNSSNEYKTHDNFVRVLAYYGYYPTKQNNSYKMFKCPNCNKDAYLKTNDITLNCNHRNHCNYKKTMFDFVIEQESCSFIAAKDKVRDILQDNRYTDIKDICKAAVTINDRKEVANEKEGKKIIKLFNRLLRTAKYKDVLDYIMDTRQLQHIPFDRLYIGAYEKYYKDSKGKWQKAHYLVLPTSFYPLSLNLRCVNSDVDKEHRYLSSIKFNTELYKVHQTSTILKLEFKDNKALKCVIAEGYIDMLSVMECNITDLKKHLCYISLNSVANQHKLIERLESAEVNDKEKEYIILLDNDKTGRAAAEQLAKQMQEKGYKVTNITDTFYNTDSKDINEMLVKDRVNLVNRLREFI